MAETAPLTGNTRRSKPSVDIFSVSWGWLKTTLFQTATVGGIVTVITALVWTAGYVVVGRRNLTLGVPNTASASTAYQQTGADWLTDMAAVLQSALTAPQNRTRVVLLAAAIVFAVTALRIGLRRRRSAAQRAVLTAGLVLLHVGLASFVVRDGLSVIEYFSADDVLSREVTDLLALGEAPQSLIEALFTDQPALIRPSYNSWVVRFAGILLVALLAGWTIHRNFKPAKTWRRRLLASQAAVGLALLVHLSLLAQFYGQLTAITFPRCVEVQFRPDLSQGIVTTLGSAKITALLLSDLAFGGDELHLLQIKGGKALLVFNRGDIIKYAFLSRSECGTLSLHQ
jgi:hypothetical protein